MSEVSAFELEAVWLSLQIAVATVLINTPLAVLLATLMARTHWRGKLLADTLILLPMSLPPAALGFALWMGMQDGDGWAIAWTGWARWHLQPFPAGAWLAASFMTLPLMVRVLRPALEAADPMLLPVARTLGASPWQGWWTLTLPLVWPAVGSAMALGLSAAWGESGAALVLAACLQPQALNNATAPVALVQALLQHPHEPDMAWRLAGVSLLVAMVSVAVSEWARARWLRRWQARINPAGFGEQRP